MTTVVCLLTVRPCQKTYEFYKELKRDSDYKVFIVIDDNEHEIPGYDGYIPIIKLDSKMCEENGYKNCVATMDNRFTDKACSRDKALYYFTKEYTDYEHIWLIEEDVFIPSYKTLKFSDVKYKNDNYDLLSQEHHIVREKKDEWHWKLVDKNIKLDPPYAKSMICAIRCSRRLMKHLGEYADKYKNLFLDEALFNTIAIQNNLNVGAIPELHQMKWRLNWHPVHFNKTQMLHPMKDIEQQYEFRSIYKEDLDNWNV